MSDLGGPETERATPAIRHGADGTTDCWFHGPEPVTDETFIVCFECGHAWTRDALEEANFEGQQECAEAPCRQPADTIDFCPECIHDF